MYRISKRTHISYNHGNSKAVRQEKNSALIDLTIRKHDHVSGFEVELYIFVCNKPDRCHHSMCEASRLYEFLDVCHVRITFLHTTSNDKVTVSELLQCLNENIESFIWSDIAEEQQNLIGGAET